MLIRVFAGIEPYWGSEAGWVIALLIGGISFLVGVGSMSDWMKWWRGIETPLHHGPRTVYRLGHATLALITITKSLEFSTV
ncbi:MAG: hypothetical protein R2867_35740 [Caldilineaceae bacterium]